MLLKMIVYTLPPHFSTENSIIQRKVLYNHISYIACIFIIHYTDGVQNKRFDWPLNLYHFCCLFYLKYSTINDNVEQMFDRYFIEKSLMLHWTIFSFAYISNEWLMSDIERNSLEIRKIRICNRLNILSQK